MSFFYNLAKKLHKRTGKLLAWAEKCWPENIRRRNLYRSGGRIPWSPGYIEERTFFTKEQLASQSVMKGFAESVPGFLPDGYGVGLDERCVEWPWALSRLDDAKRILDAGSALNHFHLLSLSLWQGRTLDIYTLAPEAHCEWRRGISYVFGDLRKLPYRDNEFDLIISISTLEHVGMDNSAYSLLEKHKEHAKEDLFLALAEWRRVLKPGGRLALTVPYGRYEDHGDFQQFDAELLENCAASFVPARRQETFFLYGTNGWQTVSQEECKDACYAESARQPPRPDLLAAAGAVACCQWWKR